MRLRYLHVQDHPPLHDIRLVFRQEPVMQRACAIRFVVGVNGTGKTRLLQALARAFLSLERRQQPPFAITLAYDLGRGDNARTLLLHAPREGRQQMTLVEFDQVLDDLTERGWEEIANKDWGAGPLFQIGIRSLFTGGDFPGGGAIGAYLPRVLLAYTSGAISSWDELFRPALVVKDTSILPLVGSQEEALVEERPPGWTVEQEDAFQQQLGSNPVTLAEVINSAAESVDSSAVSVGQLITADALPVALCSIALHQFVTEFRERYTQETLLEAMARAEQSGERMPALRGLLNEVGWGWLEGIHLDVAFDQDLLTAPTTKPYLSTLKRLYELASVALRQPEPSTIRQLHFDLFKRFAPDPDGPDQCVGEVLFDVLRGENGTAYDAFRRLRDLQAIGLLTGLNMTLRWRGIDDLLLYDWLSDGERMFLGRMALFRLLAGEDDALVILDEPETHFNDYWKREIVDIIDDSLRDDNSDVLISTHSSIALTDVFDTEITLLRKSAANGSIAVVRTPLQTFGASPSEIMWGVFETQDVVGQRAAEFLDMVLMVAAYPNELETIWSSKISPSGWAGLVEFKTLWEKVQQLPHQYESEERLIHVLQAVQNFTQQLTQKHLISAEDALTALEGRIGPGGYQFEFRRRLRALRSRDNDATPSQSA